MVNIVDFKVSIIYIFEYKKLLEIKYIWVS